MDRLLARQSAIQRTLTSRHLKEGHLVLYDITSSYLEGAYTQSDIVTFGYDRDGKRVTNRWSSPCFVTPKGVRGESKFLHATLKMLPQYLARSRDCSVNTA